jgi:hypothetical protein
MLDRDSQRYTRQQTGLSRTGAELYVMQLDQINSRSSLKLFLSLYCWVFTFLSMVPKSIGVLMTVARHLSIREGKLDRMNETALHTIIIVGDVCFTDTLEECRRVLLGEEDAHKF